jgi:hypothetical protein
LSKTCEANIAVKLFANMPKDKIVFGRNRRRSKERVKQTNIAVKLFPYIGNLDSGEPYFSSKAIGFNFVE